MSGDFIAMEDHVHIEGLSDGACEFFCEYCKASQKPKGKLDWNQFAAAARFFASRHNNCKPKGMAS